MIWHFFRVAVIKIQTCEWNGLWMRNASLSPLAACENTTSAGDGKCADPYSEPSIAIWNRILSDLCGANYGRLVLFFGCFLLSLFWNVSIQVLLIDFTDWMLVILLSFQIIRRITIIDFKSGAFPHAQNKKKKINTKSRYQLD